MTVVNYSVQDIFGPGEAYFVGTEWFEQTLRSPGCTAPSSAR
jgi:glycerol transport system permease protein